MKSPKEIGEILKQARQKKGLTPDKVYKATRIQSRIIDAFEEGHADKILDRVYVLLFLRKYATLLDLDADGLVANYKASLTERKTEPTGIAKEPITADIEVQKWVTLAASAVFIFVVIFFILFFGFRLRAFYRARRSVPTKTAKVSKIAPKKEIKKEAKKKTTEKGTAKTIFPTIPKDEPIKLVLQSTNDVWIKVTKDGQVAFVGTLRKNEKKQWSAKDSIGIWTGRAEALQFTINEAPIGKVSEGRIKTIRVSRDGLKIRNKWLFRAKK